MLMLQQLVLIWTSCLMWNVFAPSQVLSQPVSRAEEYCNRETAKLECMNHEVVLIQEASYGRRKVGKCIKSNEVIQAMANDPRYIGCMADVLLYTQSLCAGRRSCEIRVNDRHLEETRPCYSELKSYLELAYTCISVVEPDRSCVVSVTSTPLHIAAAAADVGVDSWSRQSNIGCGTKTQPWMLEAPAGQRINISLLDFTAAARGLTSQHLSRSTSHIVTTTTSSSSSSASCVDEKHQYGYIIDKSSVNKKNVSVCHARSNRQTHVYLSTSNTLQLFLTSDRNANFLLRVEAVGCSNLIPPEDAWIKREDDKIIIGCYTSRQTWQLRCHDGRWTGVVSNCSQGFSRVVGKPVAAENEVGRHSSSLQLLEAYQVSAIVAIGFGGLALCLVIICCGVVCLHRFYAEYSSQRQLMNKKGLKGTAESDDVSISANALLI